MSPTILAYLLARTCALGTPMLYVAPQRLRGTPTLTWHPSALDTKFFPPPSQEEGRRAPCPPSQGVWAEIHRETDGCRRRVQKRQHQLQRTEYTLMSEPQHAPHACGTWPGGPPCIVLVVAERLQPIYKCPQRRGVERGSAYRL